MKKPAPSQNPNVPSARPASPVSTRPDPLLGMQLGEFVIEERIGAGGMGVVYRAVHPLIGKQAAIKVMRLEMVSLQQVQRLLVEARAVNAVQHPGIIDIFGFGSLPDERPYVIMELLKGRPLSDFVRGRTPLPLETVVWVMEQMFSALGAAHRAGVVHRDLKPANVFICEAPETPSTVKLVDFGIAKLLESRDKPLTADGSIIGTPEFMAPEQIRGDTVGPATDLYAAGVMMFQLLTGSRPFQGEDTQVMFAHLDDTPPAPSTLVPGLSKEVDALVLHLLAKDPVARPASAEAVRERLKRLSPRVPPRTPTGTQSVEPPATGQEAFTPETLEALKAIRQPPGIGWAVVGALLILSTVATVIRLRPTTPEPSPPPPPPQLQTTVDTSDAGETDAGLEPIDAGTVVPDTGSAKKASSPRRKPKHPSQRVAELRREAYRRSAGRPLPTELMDALKQLQFSAATVKSSADRAAMEDALDSWERRLDQHFPPR
jgi:eukaryotic-like serine/threonine-protein kinase